MLYKMGHNICSSYSWHGKMRMRQVLERHTRLWLAFTIPWYSLYLQSFENLTRTYEKQSVWVYYISHFPYHRSQRGFKCYLNIEKIRWRIIFRTHPIKKIESLKISFFIICWSWFNLNKTCTLSIISHKTNYTTNFKLIFSKL